MEDFLSARARVSPEAPALIFEGRTWTYTRLNREVAGVCARLDAAGVRPGERVGVLLGNVPLYVALVHALIRMRAVIVPLNLRLRPVELGDQVRRAELAWLVHAPDRGETVQGLLAGDRLISAEALSGSGFDREGAWEGRPIDLADDWGLLFTSGTTGTPRGAVISLAAMHAGAVASAFRLGTLPDDRWLLVMPLYHIGGLAIVFRCCLYGTTVVLQDGFDPEAAWSALARDRVSLLSVVPTMLRRLIAHAPDRKPPVALRLALVGGAAAPEELVVEALGQGWPLALTYGLTEAVSQVATATTESVRRNPASVGRPLMGTRVRIGAPGACEFPRFDFPPGEPGEIYVAGPNLMRGYLGESPIGGWLATGDIGFLDADGDLTILQRRTDLIVSGGENVYPAEIERVLASHAGIRESCVVGIEDDEWGQRPAAVVVRRDPALTAAEIDVYLRQRMAGYKLPGRILFVDELPCTPSGKVCRPDVIELLAQDQGA